MNGAMGETASVYAAVGALCAIYKSNPDLHASSIVIRESGRIEISAVGAHGVTKEWARAIPNHRVRDGVASTFYGSEEADVIEAAGITVTVRRPLVGPGGVA